MLWLTDSMNFGPESLFDLLLVLMFVVHSFRSIEMSSAHTVDYRV